MTDGVASAFCTSSIRSVNYCTIQFSRDPSYSNLTTPTIGPVNILFQFPFMETSSSTYHHQATLNVGSTHEIIVRSRDVISFSNEETFPGTSTTDTSVTVYTASRNSTILTLKSYQLGLLGLLIAFLLVALATCFGIISCLLYRGTVES